MVGHDFEMLYPLGLQNKVSDALSKVSHYVELAMLSTPEIVDVEIVLNEVEKDEVSRGKT